MTVEATKKNDETAIQRFLDDGIRSLRDKNIEGVMSLYAQEVVSFDIVPPLRYMGADAYRKRWEETFSSFQGPIGYEIHDLTITVGDDVAFTHSLNRISGTLTTGQQTDLWLRSTCIGYLVHPFEKSHPKNERRATKAVYFFERMCQIASTAYLLLVCRDTLWRKQPGSEVRKSYTRSQNRDLFHQKRHGP